MAGTSSEVMENSVPLLILPGAAVHRWDESFFWIAYSHQRQKAMQGREHNGGENR